MRVTTMPQQDLVLEAFNRRQIGEDAIISPIEERSSTMLLGATGVQIPHDDLDNLHAVREEDGMSCVDEIDKQAELTGEMQLKQEDQSYVHASSELHLHVAHVVANKHEADQYL
ncbi:hypothetical protein Tco_0908113 [Tanacetum coccineum]|uniref:Uncharacterized protein n=1 Tax=Tanacetum coccineum TaxID=301880 RepID=A0ABQ5CPH0_9ASTR